jgi:hypothetical protein
MDHKGKTAVLSAIFVLVGMICLNCASEKGLAYASIHAVAKATCGAGMFTHYCDFKLVRSVLMDGGKWFLEPTASGTFVQWGAEDDSVPILVRGTVVYAVEQRKRHIS